MKRRLLIALSVAVSVSILASCGNTSSTTKVSDGVTSEVPSTTIALTNVIVEPTAVRAGDKVTLRFPNATSRRYGELILFDINRAEFLGMPSGDPGSWAQKADAPNPTILTYGLVPGPPDPGDDQPLEFAVPSEVFLGMYLACVRFGGGIGVNPLYWYESPHELPSAEDQQSSCGRFEVIE